MAQGVFTREQIEAMQNVDIRTVDPDTLRDIRDGEGQLHRHGRDPGGQNALLHTVKMLTEIFSQNTLDICRKLC